MQHEKTTDSARVTLGRRNLVRGAAWAAPVVGVAAAAPAYAASTTFPIPILGAARWEWGNPSNNWIFRGITVCADRPIVAGDLTITITAPNSVTRAVVASVSNCYINHNDGVDNWNGSYYDPAGILTPPQSLGASDWTLVQSNTTNSYSTTQAVLTFTYQGALNRGDCVTLGASVDVDTNCSTMRITQTPQMSYTVSAVQSGYTTSPSRIIWHSNDTV